MDMYRGTIMDETIKATEISIIVPTFKEAGNVEELVRRIERCLSDYRWEVIFVDDDSPDGTADVVRAIAIRDPRVRCIQRIGRRGLASACIEGMLAASAPILAVMDADLQHDEALLPAMLKSIQSGDLDVVVASRYVADGSVGDWSQSRESASRFATITSRLVLKQPISDPMSGFFMITRDTLGRTVRGLSGIGFKILLDILATDRNLRVKELGYRFRERHEGESKFELGQIWDFGMLLADKLVGKYIPASFLSFSIIGGFGVAVHMFILTISFKVLRLDFFSAQALATILAMAINFALNNALTYRDRRLSGRRWIIGLATFVLTCSVGAVANVGIATVLFEQRAQWALSALAGILVGAVWNYGVSQVFTWGRVGRR